MKKFWSCLLWTLGGLIFLGVILVTRAWKPYHLNSSDLNACTSDSDCVIVPSSGCGNPTSINRSNLSLWDLHRKLRKFPPLPVMCAPSLPPEYFQPECLQDACREVGIHDHAILELLQRPVNGATTDLVFRFQTMSGLEHGQAQIEFNPNLVMVNSGGLTWEGSLAPDTEGQMQTSITFPVPGYYHIRGKVFSSMADYMEDNVYLLLTEDGVQYGARLENQWDIGHLAYPVGEEDSRLSRDILFDPVPALNQQTVILYRIRSTIDIDSADMQLVLPPGGFEILDVTYPAGGEGGKTPQNVTISDKDGSKQSLSMPIQLWWRGPARAGETLEIRTTVKTTAPGWGLVYGELRSAELPVNVIYAFVYVDGYNGFYEIREKP